MAFTSRELRRRAKRRRAKLRRTVSGDPSATTAAAKQIWTALWPEEPWPSRWQVLWCGFMRGAMGLCLYGDKQILLSYGDAIRASGEVVTTLVHEFIHVRCPRLRHGKEFSQLCVRACARIGLEYKDRWTQKENAE